MAIKKIIEFVVKSKDAKKDVDNLNKSLENNEKLGTSTTQSTKDMDKSYRGASKGAKILQGGIRGIGLAIKATGIGLLVAGVVQLTQALMKNQVIMNAVQDVTNSISFVFQTLVNTVVELVQSVRDGSEQFDSLRKAGGALIKILLFPLRIQFNALKLGILSLALAFQKAGNIIGLVSDEAVEKTKSMVNETKDNIVEITKETAQAAIDLKDNAVGAFKEVGNAAKVIGNELKEATKEANNLATSINNLETLIAVEGAKEAGRIALLKNQAEELKRIRDDESLSFQERIEASEKYRSSLEEINNLNLKQAQRELDLARLQAKLNGNNEESLVRVIEAENKLLEVQLGVEKEQTRWFRRDQRLRNNQTKALEELEAMSTQQADEEIVKAEEVYNKKLELINKVIDDESERNRLIEEATELHNEALAEIERNKQLSIKEIIDEVNKDEETFEERLEREQEEALLELEALGATEEQKLALEIEFANRLAEHQKKLAEEEMARQKAMNEYKVKSGLQALGALSKAMDEQSSISKGIAIAETTWNTANAIMTAMKDTEMPYLARLANSITVGAMGLSQIKRITSTNPGKGGASGGGGTRGMSSPVQPSFNIVGDARQEALDEIDAEREQRPVKAYVVAGEVTTQQEADRNRVRNSRFL